MVATSQRARLQAAAAELEPSLAAELLAKLAARCFDATPTAASGRRLSVVGRRSSPSGASQARRASGMVAGQAASPAPVGFATLLQGVLGAAPEDERVAALTHVLRQQEVVPRARRAALAEALGAPVAEVGELRLELSRSRDSLRALSPQPQPPEPARFQQLFGVDLPPPLPGGGTTNAPSPGEAGVLPRHAARQLVGELFALKLAETAESSPADAASAFRPARSRRGEMPPPFARFAYEALLRKHGVRSTARQALCMLLAAVEPAPDAERRTPTPTPPSEEDPFLLFAPMCGIAVARRRGRPPRSPSSSTRWARCLPTGPACRPGLQPRVSRPRPYSHVHPTRRRTGLGPAAQREPARAAHGAARSGARGRAAPARLRLVLRRREPRAARAAAGPRRPSHGDSRGRRRRQRGRAGGRARGAATAARPGTLPPTLPAAPCAQAAIVPSPRLQPCV